MPSYLIRDLVRGLWSGRGGLTLAGIPWCAFEDIFDEIDAGREVLLLELNMQSRHSCRLVSE